MATELLSPGSAHWRPSLIDFRLDKAADITIFGLSILFVVWLRRARINAERHDYRQRRVRGWVFWGWIVPIVNIWFPFQIMVGELGSRPAHGPEHADWQPVLPRHRGRNPDRHHPHRVQRASRLAALTTHERLINEVRL